MQFKSLVSAVALSAAFALAGPAFAQTTFNGAVLSETDLPAVTERCEQLVNADATESLSTESSTDTAATDNNEVSDAGDASATSDSVPDVNEVENAVTTIDLDTITLEQCTAAGLGGSAM